MYLRLGVIDSEDISYCICTDYHGIMLLGNVRQFNLLAIHKGQEWQIRKLHLVNMFVLWDFIYDIFMVKLIWEKTEKRKEY